MRCVEFSARFDELLDERREPLDEPEMAAHAASCADCRRTAASISVAIGALADLHVPLCAGSAGSSATEPSVERILAAIRRDTAAGNFDAAAGADPIRPATFTSTTTSSAGRAGSPAAAPSLWRGSAFYALLATAATVVLAAYPVWRWNAAPPAGHSLGNPIAATGEPAPTGPNHQIVGTAPKPNNALKPDAAVDPESLPSFTELAQESRDSYEQLARDTRRSLDGAMALASVFSSEVPPHPASGVEPNGWLNQVEDGLEPLKRSTLGTLDVLRQVVPADTETRS